MKRLAFRVVLAATLVAAGWTAGRASQVQADFEIQVTSPQGSTTITCVRGCGLQFIRNEPDRAAAKQSFTYQCLSREAGTTCGGTLHGWITR